MMRLRYLMALMVLSVMTAFGAKTENVTFNYRKWDKVKMVLLTERTTQSCTLIEGQNNEWQGLGEREMVTYYVVRGDVKRQTLNCYGQVHIVLCDGAHLTCTGGIKVEKFNQGEIHIHTQSDGDNRGRLTVTNSYLGAAGIGAGEDLQAGDVFIHGGTINVTGGEQAAGIGSGRGNRREDGAAGTTYIYAGDVTAEGGEKGAGIGSGCAYDYDMVCGAGKLYIYGGNVKAKGGYHGAGVGGGGGRVNVGNWTTRAGNNGGTVVIYDGTLTAEGGYRAAGIGSGSTNDWEQGKRHGGSLEVFGGTVTATGGEYGAGIGGGCNAKGAVVTIHGGTVRAQGGRNAAGIGGGEDGEPGWCNISGGDVKAIAGIDCQGREAGKGSAIGFGRGASKKYKPEHLVIDTTMAVTAGDHETNIERTFTAPERIDACQWRNFAHIEVCKHSDATYTIIDGKTHRHNCVHCLTQRDLAHDFGTAANRHDCVCGQKYNDVTTALAVTRYYRDSKDPFETASTTDMVVRSHKYVLPAPPAIKGMCFMGYSTDKEVGHMLDSEENTLIPAGKEVTVTDELHYYARYRYILNTSWDWYDDYKKVELILTNDLLQGGDTLQINSELVEDLQNAETHVGRRTYKASAVYYWKDKSGAHEDISYIFTDEEVEEYYYEETFALDANKNDNEAIVDKYTGHEATVTIKNMTLFKDGKLHSLCLPFSAEIKDSPLEGATIYSVASQAIVDGQLQITFKPITEDWVAAGEPYFVKWPEGTDIDDPTFYEAYVDGSCGMAIQDQYYELGGTFDPMSFYEGDKVFFLEDSKLMELDDDNSEAFSNYLIIPFEKNDDGEIVVTSVRLAFEGDITVEANLYDKWEGNGMADTPYLIYTRGQLQQMASAFNDNAAAVNGKYFRQVSNIGFNKAVENNFTPVKNFTGHYDGNGYVINGVNIKNQGNNSGDDGALFLKVESGSTIKNIILRNSTIEGSRASAIAVQLEGTASIDNCHVLKDVEVCSYHYAAGGIVDYMNDGAPLVTNCSSQASVTANQSYAGGVVGMLVKGSVTNCMYLGNSLAHGQGLYRSCAITNNNGGTVKDCYFTAPTLEDDNAKLMPDATVDNTTFLTLLGARDNYLQAAAGNLTEDRICYDLAINGREYKAVENNDNTWSRRAFTLSLPFDMAIPEEQIEDINVYRLHEIDTDKKAFVFTNEFPFLKAGEPYILVISKGSLTFHAKNVLAKAAPAEPESVKDAAGNKELGYWCGNFKKLENEELVEQKAYIMQRNGTFRHIDKVYATKPNVAQFLAYFSAMEPIGTSFKMKFVKTENGEETGEETDFPADLFFSDFDLEDETGIQAIDNGQLTIDNEGTYDLQGRKLSGKPTAKGMYIMGSKKIIVK